jgi:hypothetical protein
MARLADGLLAAGLALGCTGVLWLFALLVEP